MNYIKSLIMIILVGLLSACGTSDTNEKKKRLRVACVGDSITSGLKLTNPNEDSYPSQLDHVLGNNFEVVNFGASGATVLKEGNRPYWTTSLFEPSHVFNPDIVIIMLGTNDAKPVNWMHNEAFISDYSALIASYKILKSNPLVYVCYPPPLYREVAGITDERIRKEVIFKIRQVTQDNNIITIDNYSVLSNMKSLFPDGVHPNKEGAFIIAKTVSKVID